MSETYIYVVRNQRVIKTNSALRVRNGTSFYVRTKYGPDIKKIPFCEETRPQIHFLGTLPLHCIHVLNVMVTLVLTNSISLSMAGMDFRYDRWIATCITLPTGTSPPEGLSAVWGCCFSIADMVLLPSEKERYRHVVKMILFVYLFIYLFIPTCRHFISMATDAVYVLIFN